MRNKQRLLTPGPTQTPERVRLAMAHDSLHHRKAPFKKLLGETLELLGPLFGTAGPVIPLAASGSGAMSAAVSNLFAPGESVLVIEGGRFGQRWSEICAARQVTAIPLTVEWGTAATPEMVAQALKEHPQVSAVLMQICETSTGVMHPVRAIAAVARKHGVLLVADGVSSISISPCRMDDWGIDCLLTGSQKGLLLPPGLSLIALSPGAWEKAESLPCRDYYFDLRAERDNLKKNQNCFTPAVSLIMGLRESLEMFAEEGLEAVFHKQWALTSMTRRGLEAMGFELLAQTDFAWGLTSFRLPAGVSSGPMLAGIAQNHGITLASGMGHLTEHCIRFGHMGWIDWGDVLAGLHAVATAFRAQGGFIGCRDYLEQAMAAYESALTESLPLL